MYRPQGTGHTLDRYTTRSPASKGSLDRGQVVTNRAHPVRCVGSSHTLRRNDYGKIGRLPPNNCPEHRRNSNFLLRPIYNARIVLIPDDKHNENEIQVDASFKRIVNGINTRQIAIPSRGRNLSKRKSFSYFLKKKRRK